MHRLLLTTPYALLATLPSWLTSDTSLAIRASLGIAIFATLAIVDYRRNRERATRWREYAFLAICVAFAIVYGIANDLVTSRISVEYFLYFKGAADRVAAEVAAHPELHRGALDLQAIRIGTLATWSVGLIVGAAILVTNTVGQRPRLRMRRLLRVLPIVVLTAVPCAIALGWLGWTDRLPWIRANFDEPSLRPANLRCVYAIHLGGYAGGGIGLLLAIARVATLRRRLTSPTSMLTSAHPA